MSGVVVCVRCLMLVTSVCALSDVVFRVPPVTVQHSAVARAVGTSSKNATPKHEQHQEPLKNQHQQHQYEEYFIEHDISAVDARRAADRLTEHDLSVVPAGCGTCSRREMSYCEWRVVADHCCCDRRFLPEPVPWLPHTCYVGPDRCETFADDCQHYVRLRDCCCYNTLARKWRSILSSSPHVSVISTWTLLTCLLAAVISIHLYP